MKKRKLVVQILSALSMLLILGSCGKEKAAPSAYEIGGESIPSLSTALAEEDAARLASEELPSESQALEPDAQFIYRYEELTFGNQAAEEYVTLLTAEDMGFQVVDAEDRIAETPDFSAGDGQVSLAKPSSEDGRLLQMNIAWAAESCDITVTRPKGKIAAEKVEPMTTPDALHFLENLSPSTLGLEGESMSEYRVYALEGQVMVNGIPCIQMQVYKNDLPEGSNAISGSYMLTGDKKHLYRHEEGGSVVELSLA